MNAQRIKVFLRRIALVAIKTVLRKSTVQGQHFGVARCFGENRGRRDRRDRGITTGDGTNRQVDRGAVQSVDKNLRRRSRQLSDRTFHRQQRSLQNIQSVYFVDGRICYGPGKGSLPDVLRKRLPTVRGECFRVGQPRDRSFRIEHYSGGIYRPRQGSSARLVHAAN